MRTLIALWRAGKPGVVGYQMSAQPDSGHPAGYACCMGAPAARVVRNGKHSVVQYAGPARLRSVARWKIC